MNNDLSRLITEMQWAFIKARLRHHLVTNLRGRCDEDLLDDLSQEVLLRVLQVPFDASGHEELVCKILRWIHKASRLVVLEWFQAVAVLMLVPLHTLFMETRDPSLTVWFLLFFVLCCFAQRCNMWERRKRGEYEHSQYNGYPWLRGEKSNVSEIAFKTWVEPVIVVGGGLLLCGLDRAFGSFIVTCGASMCIKGLVSLQLRQTETADMRDSMIEQQQRADRFRNTSR